MAAFVGGALFGCADVKILTSKDAKKVYVYTTAAVLRMKDCVMNTAAELQENCEDIPAEAKNISGIHGGTQPGMFLRPCRQRSGRR